MSPTRFPCTGDWVVLRTWPDERLTIEAVLPRRTAVIRASAGAEALGQILVANVDTVAAVVPVDPEPDLGLVERLLALAWESGATARGGTDQSGPGVPSRDARRGGK